MHNCFFFFFLFKFLKAIKITNTSNQLQLSMSRATVLHSFMWQGVILSTVISAVINAADRGEAYFIWKYLHNLGVNAHFHRLWHFFYLSRTWSKSHWSWRKGSTWLYKSNQASPSSSVQCSTKYLFFGLSCLKLSNRTNVCLMVLRQGHPGPVIQSKYLSANAGC